MKDLLTGEEFEPKKSSQKFANAKNRIKNNNMLANDFRKEKSVLDKPLSKNLKILNELMSGKREASFHQEFLRGKGFDFKAVNGLEQHEGKYCPCVYQYMLLRDGENIKIIRHDRY